MRVRNVAAGALVAAVVMTGCSGNASPAKQSSQKNLTSEGWALQTPTPQKGGTLTVLGSSDFTYLDPVKGNDGGVTNMYRLLYRQLTAYKGGTGKDAIDVVPDLAKSWDHNTDSTQWTFHLQDGIKYEDGTPIVAADFKYAIERGLDPRLRLGNDAIQRYVKGANEYKGVYSDPAGLSSVKAPDDKTLTIELAIPMPNFPAVATRSLFTPFPKDKVSSPDQLEKQPIASGPYKLSAYDRGAKMTLVRNPNWDAKTDGVRKAYPDSFVFLFGLDSTTVDQRLISSAGADANALAASTNPVQAADLRNVEGNPAVKSRTIKDLPACNYFLTMNSSKPPLDNIQVRQAITYAINKKQAITSVGGPQMAVVSNDMLLPTFPGYQPFNLYPTPDDSGDVEKAKQLLASAGASGIKLTMDVRNLPTWQGMSQAIQDSLKRAGLNVDLNVIDSSKYYATIGNPTQQHDIAVTGWCGAGDDPSALLAPLFEGSRIYPSGNNNTAQLNDPDINAKFKSIPMITDANAQNQAWMELNKEIMQKAPVVPFLRMTPLQIVGTNVGGAYAAAGLTGYVDLATVGLIDPAKK